MTVQLKICHPRKTKKKTILNDTFIENSVGRHSGRDSVFAYPASANLTATKVDGVIFQYTAVDTNGVLTVTFTNQASFVTQLRFRLA